MRTASRIGFLGLGLALACLWGAVPADAARKARGCAAGRFVVTQGQDLLGGAALPAVLVVDGPTLSVEGPCPVQGKARKRRKGTSLSARWERCGGLENIRLRATARDCATVRGRLRARKRRAALLAAASACGDGMVDAGAGEECDGADTCGAGVQCNAACRCDGPAAEPLECGAEGYPCAWSEVPAAVTDRSVELAEQAGAILDGGGATSEAVKVLEGDDLAELQYDEHLIRFRLPGGRPVWLGTPGTMDPLPGPPPSDAVPAVAFARRASAPTAGTPRSVVSPGKLPRSAYVLDPFAYQPAMAGEAPLIAGLLGEIPGYEGNVTYLANTAEDALAVTLREFTRFAGHDVVHVVSHGSRLCDDRATGEALVPCQGVVGVAKLSNPVAAALKVSAELGMAPFRVGDGKWWVVVTADFLRYYYPGGLRDTLVVLDGCKTAGTDIVHALSGPNTNVAGWSDNVVIAGAKAVMQELYVGLGQGRAIHEVYDSMGGRVKDPYSPAKLVIGASNIRIRDLPRVIDAATGQTLTSNGTVQVIGRTGDGEPDSLLLDTEFEGIDPADGEIYTVHFTIDGTEFFSGPLIEFAQPHTEYRWSGSGQFDLDYDVAEGQPLDIEVTVDLPEGGKTVFAASPRATSPHWSPGRVWHGTFTKVTNIGVATITLVVDATFERDPDEPPTTQPTFLLKSGTMTWSLLDAPGDSCTRTMPALTYLLVDDADDTLTFDLTKNPVEYRGFATSAGESVEVVVSCPWGDSVTHMTTGGVWFVATGDDHLTVSGDGFSADFEPNAVSHVVWNATKVE
jgi:hypothetical protein